MLENFKKKKSQQIPKRAVHGNVTNEQHQQERPNCWDEKKNRHTARKTYTEIIFFSVFSVMSFVGGKFTLNNTSPIDG